MSTKYLSLLLLLQYLLPGSAASQVVSYQTTVDMQVTVNPIIVITDGQRTVYYELRLANFAKDTIAIRSLAVLNAADSAVMYQLDDSGVQKHFAEVAQRPRTGASLLPPGAMGVIFLEVTLPATTTPKAFIHQLTLDILQQPRQTTVVVTGGTTAVINTTPVIFGAPLSRGPWAAVYDPLWATGHRRVFYTVDGTARLPGRFAIDFIKLNSAGKFAAVDDNVIKNWYGYSADVLAVSDGIIASVRDDVTESATIAGYTPALPENATGNYISLKTGDRQYVFYEHLKPGSITVKPGQRVKKGQVIASIGFTGQTTGPHLHLHLADTGSPLGAEGLPFAFEYYQLLGRYTDFSGFGKTLWAPAAGKNATNIHKDRPVSNAVISFD